MIRVYAFVDEGSVLPPRQGVDGAALEMIAVGPARAVVSRHCDGASEDVRAAAVAHGLVVEALVGGSRSVLPVRFGETFADDDAFAKALDGRESAISAALARVRGCVEVGVRVLTTVADAADARSGTEYLRARLAEASQSQMLDDLLEPLVRAPAKAGGNETAYLVEHGRVSAVLEAIRAFAGEHPSLTVAWTGPWAPYSFGGSIR